MIHWLIQSTSIHPDLDRGIAPADLLSPVEQTHLAHLKMEKRRREWLLGRWTAKRLLQSYIEQQTGVRPPLHAVTVANDADGAPVVTLGAGWEPGLQEGDSASALNLSISHCHDRALCALYVAPDERGVWNGARVRIGADIERIEPRSPLFVADYFTEEEIALVRRAPLASRDRLVTLIWSAKEAALKALRLGLRVDTRRISCLIDAIEPNDTTWTSFDIRCDPQLLGASAATAPWALVSDGKEQSDQPPLTGWWRTSDQYVLTMAILRES